MVHRVVGDGEGLSRRSCGSGDAATAGTGIPQETGQELGKKHPNLSSHPPISC